MLNSCSLLCGGLRSSPVVGVFQQLTESELRVDSMKPANEHQDKSPTERIARKGQSGPWQVELANPKFTLSQIVPCGACIRIGSSVRADIRVEDPTVSALHAELRACSEGLEVRDLDSKNGVFIGGARVQSALLRGAHCGFVLGRTTVSICPLSDSDDRTDEAEIPGLVGRSQLMRRLAREIRRFARLRAPVLLQGESGTGKDVVAHTLHELSGRQGNYVALNVGGLTASLSDAELFGHRRGAFTGAVHSRAGAFEEAHGGTLFLDEIADLDPAIQVKLLRVVEDGRVRPLGTNELLEVDARVVSASWSNIEERVLAGEFRTDLYHRISTITLRIPPLRKRLSDLPVLTAHFLQRFADELGEHELTGAGLARLMDYAWPGNVRELGSVVYRAAAIAGTVRHIDLQHVEQALPKLGARKRFGLSRSEAERLLEQHDGNVSAAARSARVPRTTFRAWLRKTGREEEEEAA